MSSEDTAVDEAEKVYHVKILPWRRDMVEYLKIIDDQRHVSDEKFAEGGSKPVRRVQGSRLLESVRKPPRGLPRSLYDTNWIEGKDEDYIEMKLQLSEKPLKWLKIRQGRG